MNNYAYMILSTAGVKPGRKSKEVAAELYVITPLLPILSAARNHLTERQKSTNLAAGART